MNKEEIFSGLANAVINMDTESVIKLANASLTAGIPASESIENGLSAGMERVGELFSTGEYFVPEVVVCSDTLYAGLNILKPVALKNITPKGRILIGVVEGDTHDIGKNIIAMMLEAAGFDIIDLGRNVPLKKFSQCAIEDNVDVIALSSLMTTTMEGMKTVIEDIKKISTDRRRYVIVGGAPVSRAFAEKIGADGYSSDGSGAVKLVKKLLGIESNAYIKPI